MPPDTGLLSRVDAYIDAHLEETIAELARLCAQPSVSAQRLGIDECAALVAGMLQARGFEAEVVPSAGHPGSRAHAPDEHIRIEDFVRGVKHMARVLVALGQ